MNASLSVNYAGLCGGVKRYDVNATLLTVQLGRGNWRSYNLWRGRYQCSLESAFGPLLHFARGRPVRGAGAWSQDAPPPKRVLMLYGHDPKAPGVVAFTNELHATVRAGSPTRVEFYDELLDLERFPENEGLDELVNYIVEKYRGFSFRLHPDGRNEALKFATNAE